MFTNLRLLLNSIVNTIVAVFNLMSGNTLLNGVLALWFLGIVVSILIVISGGSVAISGRLISKKRAQAKKDAKRGPKSKPKAESTNP